MSNTTLLHDESCFELLCLQTGMSDVIWRAQMWKVQSWAVCIHSSHANTCCVLVLFEVLTESVHQLVVVHWKEEFYRPIFLVQVRCDCAIMEVWPSFHDTCRTWSHCKHRAGTSSRASRDLALPLSAPNILHEATLVRSFSFQALLIVKPGNEASVFAPAPRTSRRIIMASCSQFTDDP